MFFPVHIPGICYVLVLVTCPCYSHPANANKSLCTVWFACWDRWCHRSPNVHERCIVYITEVSAENRANPQSRPEMTEKGKEKHWLEFWLCLGRLSVWTPHLHQRTFHLLVQMWGRGKREGWGLKSASRQAAKKWSRTPYYFLLSFKQIWKDTSTLYGITAGGHKRVNSRWQVGTQRCVLARRIAPNLDMQRRPVGLVLR